MSVSFKKVISVKPICQHLIQYLSVITYINLRIATVNYISHQNVTPHALALRRLRQHLMRGLRFTEMEAEHIERLLAGEYGAMILTGGFLVALLTGAPFDAKTQDINLLAFESHPDFGFTEASEADEDGEGCYMIQDTHVRIICDPSACSSYGLVTDFDMDICKNMLSARSLCIENLQGLTKQTCIMKMEDVLRSEPGMSWKDTLVPMYERLQHRITKYKARGYDVRVVHPKEVQNAFCLDLNNAALSERDALSLMGKHHPDSCVYTRDCKCESRGKKFCDTMLPDGKFCSCEHHLQFYAEVKRRWAKRKQEAFTREYMAFWKL